MKFDPIKSELTGGPEAELDRRSAEDESAPDEITSRNEAKGHDLPQIQRRAPTSARRVELDDDLANDLIENNPKFRALLEKSLASGREPFPLADEGD